MTDSPCKSNEQRETDLRAAAEAEDMLRNSYLEWTGLSGADRRDARRAALDRAWINRNFEVELYWKRSLYFSGFQVAVFAGVALMLRSLVDPPDSGEPFLIFVGFLISLLGLVSATIWTMVERGSRDWQVNWERHIDMLEDEFTGSIYKTYLFQPKNARHNYLPFSVSALNSMMTLLIVFFWAFVSTIFGFGLVAISLSATTCQILLAVFIPVIYVKLVAFLTQKK